ncbi:MAG: hypothetical protein LC650_04945 [Actinobacteria bacterium]|nr:hypothetical protein [Actinomycetota bacterium]
MKALIKEYQRAGFIEDKAMMAEIRTAVKRDFGQIAALTEAEAKVAVGHARKLKSAKED